MPNLTATFTYSGLPDYWGGAGGRGEMGGCAFAYYGKDTTLRDLVDQWVEDYWNNEHDFAGCPEAVDCDEIRDCILAMFTDSGRADYASGVVCELATDYAACMGDEDEGEIDDYPMAIIWIDWSDHPEYVEDSVCLICGGPADSIGDCEDCDE